MVGLCHRDEGVGSDGSPKDSVGHLGSHALTREVLAHHGPIASLQRHISIKASQRARIALLLQDAGVGSTLKLLLLLILVSACPDPGSLALRVLADQRPRGFYGSQQLMSFLGYRLVAWLVLSLLLMRTAAADRLRSVLGVRQRLNRT